MKGCRFQAVSVARVQEDATIKELCAACDRDGPRVENVEDVAQPVSISASRTEFSLE